ncbi:MAG: hypothetical protein F6K47_15260 [Symploca sp. SIO2E6]|nr:hypothetical protein [Symploca sp. SIO2E6]
MGIGNWELGIGNWELGMRNEEWREVFCLAALQPPASCLLPPALQPCSLLPPASCLLPPASCLAASYYLI